MRTKPSLSSAEPVGPKTVGFAARRSWRAWMAQGVALALVVSLADWVVDLHKPVSAAPVSALAGPEAPLTRPDEKSALITARLTGRKVEVLSRRSETATVHALPNGSFEAQVDAGQVRFRDDAGEWVDIDTTMVARPDGSVGPRAHPKGLVLSGPRLDGDNDLATIGRGDDQVVLGWRGALPAPVLAGNRATYVDVRPGVDLVVEATRSGFEQFLVVRSRAALAQVATVAMPWRTGALTARAAGRGLGLQNSAGKEVWLLPEPVMWDASTNLETRDPVRHAPVGVSVAPRPGGRSDLVLTPDPAFLADPALVFPVTIDPVLTPPANFDTWVQTGVTSSQHTSMELRLGTTTSGSATARSFLRFDTTPMWGATVASAALNLYETEANSCNGASWELWYTDFATTSTVWSNQPGWVSHYHSTTLGCGEGWTSIPATTWVQNVGDWRYDYMTMGLKATSESAGSGSWKKFHSSEWSWGRPHLYINYHYPAQVLGRSTNPSTSCLTGSGRPYINTVTPTLWAQPWDPEAASSSVQFEWWVTGGAAPLGSATAGPGASGSWLSTVVPAGAFANGGTYSWRARAHDGGRYGPWSSWCEFTVDTQAPSLIPGVVSATHPPTGYRVSTEPRPYTPGSTVLSLTGDDQVGTVTLPFPFTFDGQQYTSAWICTNGFLSFVDPETPISSVNPENGSGPPNAAIYAFQDNLIIDGSASIRTATLGVTPNRTFVVEWNNAVLKDDLSGARVSVALGLHEGGEISVNFSGIDSASTRERGGAAVVAVESADGGVAEVYSIRQPVLTNGVAVVYRPAQQVTTTLYTKTTQYQTYTGGTTDLGIIGDNKIVQVSLPFPFTFDGRTVTSVTVDTNGRVAFTPDSSYWYCFETPDPRLPNGALNVFCDDLVVDTVASIRTAPGGTAPNRRFVIEWNNVRRQGIPGFPPERISAAVTLHENGTITFNYTGLENDNERGANALVGIEGFGGVTATTHSYRSPALTSNTAITFTPQPLPPTSAGTAGTFTFIPGVSDVASYQYGLDTNPPTTVVNAPALGGRATVSVTPSTDGPHTLYVRSQDRAGNQSPTRAYRFFVGPGGLTSPKPGDITAAFLPLTATAHPAATGVTYQWRRADTDAWTDIPTPFVSHAVGGGPVTGWPLATTGAGAFPKLNWNVEAMLAAADAQAIPRDGPLQVRAVFAGLSNGAASPIKITFDRNLASAATSGVGPGSVNLITGNVVVSDTDVSVDSYGTDLTVTRAFNTRQAAKTDSANMFGPGWVSSTVVAAADAPYKELRVYGSLVQVGLPDGSTVGFTARNATDYDSESGLEYLKLIKTGSSYTLTADGADTVVFTQVAGAAAGHYHPTTVTVPGSGQTTALSWETVTVAGAQVTRPTRLLAPVPSGVTCTTLTRGCRALTFTYATVTTATGTAEAQWGDYLGRVNEISFTAWDPDLAIPAMRTMAVARYTYDNTGRLRAAWDPRLDYVDAGVTKHLWDTYVYDADGVLTTVKPPGQEAWQLSYTTIPGDAGKGRLASVSRSALTAGAAVTTVVYKVPVSGTGAPHNLSSAQTARWGQVEPPVSATAVFPATQIPNGNQSTGVLPSSYERATVSYLDANARTVDTVTPGGYVATTWYDQYGSTIRSLTAGNLARALNTSGSDSPMQEAALAEPLSTANVYSTDGRRLQHTYWPIRDITLPDGTVVRGRAHTANTFDEGAPTTGAPYNLVTTRVDTVAYTAAGGATVEGDPRTIKIEYDWGLRRPTASIMDPAGMALKTRTVYDPVTGLVTATTAPPGGTVETTPSTSKTIYYRATSGSGYTECDLRPEWANLPCRVQPGGQAGSGPELPVTVTTYDMFNQPRVLTEKTSTGVLRTTTTTYDSAGRVYEVAVSAAAGLGQPVPTRRNVYDPPTGQLVRSQSIETGGVVTAEIVRGYDTLGRLTTYTDADANTSTTTYDIASRVATTYDGKATRTFTYDGGSERRGLPTGLTDTQAGAFSGSYDADGRLISQTWPNGIAVGMTFDEVGTPTALSYTKPGCGQPNCTLHAETVSRSVHAQQRVHASTLSAQVYGYDVIGRLTEVRDTISGQCTTRRHAFANPKSHNRTSLTVYAPDGTGACQTTTSASSQSWTYDTADRVTTLGTAYDALGRTTTIPAADTALPAGGNVTVSYHHSDLVRSITHGTRTTIYTLDVAGKRIRSWTDNATGTVVEKRHHYTRDTDSPAWTQEGGPSYTRIIGSLGGLAATWDSAAAQPTWQLANLHGDVVASINPGDTGLSATYEATEYGITRDSANIGTRRYGWLGAEHRASDTPTGITLMGVRLYNAATGRFLQVDPVPGGSCNMYDYTCGDPVNKFDLDGRIPAWIIDEALNTLVVPVLSALICGPAALMCGAIVGAIMGALISVVKQILIEKKSFSQINIAQVIGGAVFGFLGGLAVPGTLALRKRLITWAGPLVKKAIAAVKSRIQKRMPKVVAALTIVESAVLNLIADPPTNDAGSSSSGGTVRGGGGGRVYAY